MKPALSVILLMQVATTEAWQNPLHKKHHDQPKATPVVTPDVPATTVDKPKHHFEEEKPACEDCDIDEVEEPAVDEDKPAQEVEE